VKHHRFGDEELLPPLRVLCSELLARRRVLADVRSLVCRVCVGAAVACVGLVEMGLVAPGARAAFPGGDGLLAVQPLAGDGVVLVQADGAGQRRVCPQSGGCGRVGAPRFSPDGRSLMFETGGGLRLITTDGRCVNCQFGSAASPAFLPDGTEVTFGSGGRLREDGIDGLAEPTVLDRGVADAVWSATGELAVVRAGSVWIGRPGRLRRLGSGSEPSWSPDSAQLAIVRDGWVTIVQSDGKARRLARGSSPAFAPDGRSIAYLDPRHALWIVSLAGGRSDRVDRVLGRSVDWQPVPDKPPVCVAPPASTVIVHSAVGLVTERTVPSPVVADGGENSYAYMGCLLADGQERLLERFTENSIDGATSVSSAGIGGDYAVLVNHFDDGHYNVYYDKAVEFDLRTATIARNDLPALFCPSFQSYDCETVDQIVVASDGAYAVHTQGPIICSSNGGGPVCWRETIDAIERSGIHTLDQLFDPQGTSTGPFLTGMALSSSTLTWEHAGSPRTAQLQ